MEEHIYSYDKQFHTDLIHFCALLTTILVSRKNYKRFKILKYFPIYAAIFLIGIVVNRLGTVNHVPSRLYVFGSYLDFFLTLLELLIFSNFYHQLIKNQAVRKLTVLTNLLFVLFFIYMGVADKDFYDKGISESTQSIVYTVEGIILLLLCSFYFFELFKKLPIGDLKNEPVFWVSTGLLFFMACTLPYSLLENYIQRYYPALSFALYSLFYVFYTLLFIMIIRAYLCKPGSNNIA